MSYVTLAEPCRRARSNGLHCTASHGCPCRDCVARRGSCRRWCCGGRLSASPVLRVVQKLWEAAPGAIDAMARRLLCLLLATTEAMKTKKTVSKPTSWTYLERFCFSATPEDQEEKTGDPPVLELHANFELKVKHRGGSLLMYFEEGANHSHQLPTRLSRSCRWKRGTRRPRWPTTSSWSTGRRRRPRRSRT